MHRCGLKYSTCEHECKIVFTFELTGDKVEKSHQGTVLILHAFKMLIMQGMNWITVIFNIRLQEGM